MDEFVRRLQHLTEYGHQIAEPKGIYLNRKCEMKAFHVNQSQFRADKSISLTAVALWRTKEQ